MVAAPLILAASISIWRIQENLKLNRPNQTRFVFVIELSKILFLNQHYILTNVTTNFCKVQITK